MQRLEPAQILDSQRTARLIEMVFGAAAAVAVLLVAFFDLQTSLPLLDEYARRWSIQQLVAGHGFQSVGSSPQLVQLLLSAPLALLKTDPAIWRLTSLPFIAMQGLFCGLIARDLGAGRLWAFIAGAAVICNPLYLIVSTGMMTETVFLGLFAGAIYFSLRWVDRGQFRWACVAFSVLATLQRPQGVAIAATVAFGLAMFARRCRSLRPDLIPAGALVLLSAAAFKTPEFLTQISPSLTGSSGGALGFVLTSYSGPSFVAYVLANFPALLGLAILPFTVALWLARPREKTGTTFWWIFPAILALLALAFAGLFVLPSNGHSIYVGNMLGGNALGAALLGGAKVSPFPGPTFLILVILTMTSYVVLLVVRRDPWTPARLGESGQILVLSAALQMVFIVGHGNLFDRYYLAVILPLVPIVAAAAAPAGAAPAAIAWAALATVGSLALYAIGTQDYIAWQVARHRVAQMAYAQAPVDQVDAGFEEVAENIWLPADEDPTGRLPRAVAANPQFELVFAGPDDSRPGANYSSLGSGRIVIKRNY
jgi:hypothetical protein